MKNISKKIKVSDKVVVIAGKDKGTIGVVQSINGDKVIVEGVNMSTVAVKPTQDRPEGGLDKIERPIHISNVMITDGETASRIGLTRTKNEKTGRNKVVRTMKKTGVEL